MREIYICKNCAFEEEIETHPDEKYQPYCPKCLRRLYSLQDILEKAHLEYVKVANEEHYKRLERVIRMLFAYGNKKGL